MYDKLGLEIIPIGAGDKFAVGRLEIVGDVLKKKSLPQIPQIQNEIIQLFNKLKDKTTARALAKLDECPRDIEVSDTSGYYQTAFNPGTGEEYRIKMPGRRSRMESPEVAVMEGVLLGYKNCCIKYYVETRCFGLPRDEIAEHKSGIYETDNACVLCPQCARKS